MKKLLKFFSNYLVRTYGGVRNSVVGKIIFTDNTIRELKEI